MIPHQLVQEELEEEEEDACHERDEHKALHHMSEDQHRVRDAVADMALS